MGFNSGLKGLIQEAQSAYHIIYQEFNVHFGTSPYCIAGTGGGFYNNVQSFLVIYVQRRIARHRVLKNVLFLHQLTVILETLWSPPTFFLISSLLQQHVQFVTITDILEFKLSPCSVCYMLSSG
jgi:hypothetical protein